MGSNNREREWDREADRYQQAAIHALGQLEWIVGYLHQIRKSKLASALDRNRKAILERVS
jgi:hypothetical protein